MSQDELKLLLKLLPFATRKTLMMACEKLGYSTGVDPALTSAIRKKDVGYFMGLPSGEIGSIPRFYYLRADSQ